MMLFSEEYAYDGKSYFYKDGEGRKVRWNAEKEEWATQQQQVPVPKATPTRQNVRTNFVSEFW